MKPATVRLLRALRWQSEMTSQDLREALHEPPRRQLLATLQGLAERGYVARLDARAPGASSPRWRWRITDAGLRSLGDAATAVVARRARWTA